MSSCLAGCGRSARSTREHGKFCSASCKARYHRRLETLAARRRNGSGDGRTRPETRKQLFARLLRAAGDRGVTTGELLSAGVGSRYGGRLHELRRDGWTVEGVRVRDGEWRYTLVSEPEMAA